MANIFMLIDILLILGKVSSFYNQSYDGYTFILPDTVIDGSNSRPMQLSFSDAQEWCRKNVVGSTLATIPNKDVQRNITDFIVKSFQSFERIPRSGYDYIRLNGQYQINDQWRWANGEMATGVTVHERNGNSFKSFNAYLYAKNLSIYSDLNKMSCRFICEYTGNFGECDLLLNERCYNKKQYSRSWYDAINVCLDEGGNLASFETVNDASINVSLKNLYLDSYREYWIGLQKNKWQWEDTVEPSSAIKYTNWEYSHPSNYSQRCLCLTRYRWTWKECDCFELYTFLCSLKDITPITTTLNDTIQYVIIGVSCAAIFVVIILIAAVIITKKRRNRNAFQVVKSSGFENPGNKIMESSMDFPVYAEIQDPKETNCASDTTYASVQMAETTDDERPLTGIFYAELDLLTSRA